MSFIRRNVQVGISFPIADLETLYHEAAEQGLSLSNIVRKKLGFPLVQMGRPVVGQSIPIVVPPPKRKSNIWKNPNLQKKE